MTQESQDTKNLNEADPGKDQGEEPNKTPAGPPAKSENVPTPLDDSAIPIQILQLLVSHTVDFSKSGFFFILLGCGFLYFAYSLLYHVHPTFVFILALLGLSIVLFGTGTQSLGSGEFTKPGSQAKAKFYLAGGAGVLAGVFGFGAVLGSDRIERVFANSNGYALVVFEISNPAGTNLQQATVTTYLKDGRTLPALIRDASIEVLAPISRGYGKLDVCIEVKGPKWSIERGCPTLDLKDNAPGQRPEPVQSIGTTKVDVKFVNVLSLDEAGKPASAPSFTAN